MPSPPPPNITRLRKEGRREGGERGREGEGGNRLLLVEHETDLNPVIAHKVQALALGLMIPSSYWLFY